MTHETIVGSSESGTYRGRQTVAAIGATLAIALAGCGSETAERGAAGTDTPASAEPTEAMGTPPPVEAPDSAPSETGYQRSRIGKVCTALYVEHHGNDRWVIGRPFVNAHNQPQDVLASDEGINIVERPAAEGAVEWYTLQGRPIAEGDLRCVPAKVSAREVDQPAGTIWVATSKPNAEPVPYWNLDALIPTGKGFGGVGLDYGLMPCGNLVEILEAAGNPNAASVCPPRRTGK